LKIIVLQVNRTSGAGELLSFNLFDHD